MARVRAVLHLLAIICIMTTGLETHAQLKYDMRFRVNGLKPFLKLAQPYF